MKKLVVTVLTLLTCGAVYALPVGNPSEASLMTDGIFCEGKCCDWCDPCFNWCDAFSFRIGFYGDYVFNRHMEVKQDDNPDIEDFEIYTNAGYLAVNFCNRVDVFATLGVSNINFETNAGTFGGTYGNRLEFLTQSDFSWSVGARATLWECGCTSVGLEGQYFSMKPNVERITVASTYSNYPTSDSYRFKDWQVGLGLSHRIYNLVPYVAARWGQAKYNLNSSTYTLVTTADTTFDDQENAKDWGWAVGCSLVDCEKASVTVEGRFASEKAVYVNGQFRF